MLFGFGQLGILINIPEFDVLFFFFLMLTIVHNSLIIGIYIFLFISFPLSQVLSEL